MAGHSKFKNIMHRKGAQDKKRAKTFTKITRELIVAAKNGSVDPQANSRLRAAIALAKEVNMPKDKIENAIKKATNNDGNDHYEEIRYEGYGPEGTAIIVEALTDNRNRTASEVRSTFTKYGGNLGENGSVSYLFKHVGVIIYDRNNRINPDDFLSLALEVGVLDYLEEDNQLQIEVKMEDFHEIKDKFINFFGYSLYAEIIWKPYNFIFLTPEQKEKVLKLIDSLEENDDIQNVSTNASLS